MFLIVVMSHLEQKSKYTYSDNAFVLSEVTILFLLSIVFLVNHVLNKKQL